MGFRQLIVPLRVTLIAIFYRINGEVILIKGEKSMGNFMIAYYGGDKPKTKEEGLAHMNKWKNWIDSLGDSVVNPGTPLPASKLVTATNVKDDQDPNSMKGFAVVKAESIEDAVKIAQTDPFLGIGGTIRVSQMMDMG